MKRKLIVVTSAPYEEKRFSESMFMQSVFANDDTAEVRINPVLRHKDPIADAYNRFLGEEFKDAYIVFMHADATLLAPRLVQDLDEAFEKFDVVGIAGCTSPESQNDLGWAFTAADGGMKWKDRSYLSGSVYHTDPRCRGLSVFGPAPQACTMLDGVILAMNGEKVIPAGVQFDPRFKYDMYDIDFCHTCREKGLRLGTWPMRLTHASGGRFGSKDWSEAVRQYREKWYGGSDGSQ